LFAVQPERRGLLVEPFVELLRGIDADDGVLSRLARHYNLDSVATR